ncbi:MAG: glycosyltransferase [Caulobacterales bacterium]
MDGTGTWPRWRELDDAALDAAVNGLARAAPSESARRRVTTNQAIVLVLLAGVVAAFAAFWPSAAQGIAGFALCALFIAFITLRLAAAAFVAAAPVGPPPIRWSGELPIYSILCPLHREAAIAPDLVAALSKLDYPGAKLDVKFIVEADDQETIAALRAVGLPGWSELVEVPPLGPRTKPKALNFALPRVRGAFVCVYDAEDVPHPGQLRAALDAFAAHGADLGCVQAPLVVANGDRAWIARQFAAEYAIQFGELLPFFALAKLPFAIGGTSNHFRTSALITCGGWDPYNLTEDADIGFRLARRGWRMTMIDAPTLEDAPTDMAAWIKQRTRWIKGHIQTWVVLMRDPARLFRDLGAAGFCAVQVQLAGGVLAAFAHAPFALCLAVSAVDPSGTVGREGWALAFAGYATAAYGAAVGTAKSGDLGHLRAALTMPLYWPLATIAAVRALIEFVAAPHYWAKTDHPARSARASPRSEP